MLFLSLFAGAVFGSMPGPMPSPMPWPHMTAPAMMQLNSFPAPAICNDGSPAGAYVSTNPDSNVWVVMLDGGFWCWDTNSCAYRAKSTPNLTSSKSWTQYREMGGIFSTDPTLNPQFYNANKVLVGYCTSDMFVGNFISQTTKQWNFMGQSVLEATIKLLQDNGVNGAKTVVYGGCSAGGQAVVATTNLFGTLLVNGGFGGNLVNLADAGWLMDLDPLPSSSNIALRETFRAGYSLWNATVDPYCAHFDFPTQPWLCYFTANAAVRFQFPVLVQASQEDGFQVPWNIGHGPPYNATELQYIEHVFSPTMVFQMRKTINPPSTVFSPNCFSHCLTFNDDFFNVKVNTYDIASSRKGRGANGGINLQGAVARFLEGDHNEHISQCQGFNCSLACTNY